MKIVYNSIDNVTKVMSNLEITQIDVWFIFFSCGSKLIIMESV